jgi:hypothetical protein
MASDYVSPQIHRESLMTIRSKLVLAQCRSGTSINTVVADIAEYCPVIVEIVRPSALLLMIPESAQDG